VISSRSLRIPLYPIGKRIIALKGKGKKHFFVDKDSVENVENVDNFT